MMYRECPVCGAALDPGEVCDCMKKAAPDATNIESGKVEKVLTRPISTPIVSS